VPSIDDAVLRVPADFYLHAAERGPTLHYSDLSAIRRELIALDVGDGARILEIGTGTGYSSALLAELAGPHGHITSVDISDHLAGWGSLLHHERGIRTVRCLCADGLAGYPAAAPFDRIVAWCTAPSLPRAWVEQLAPDGRLVACLPIAALPSATLITTITLDAGRPRVQAVTQGGYAQSTTAPVDDPTTIPTRWVDWSIRSTSNPAWISISWRADDDRLRTGARTALEQLIHPGHTETYAQAPLDWRSFSAYATLIGDPRLSVVALPTGLRGIGHTSKTSAAVILGDATIVADSATSPSLTALRTWLDRWEHADRPDAAALTPALIRNDSTDCPGWDLRLTANLAEARSLPR
jgi:protein-L-isoaspartate(D-aspartate) O-methyltransferase